MRTLSLLTLAFLVPLLLCAQSREDVRLSPEEPSLYDLPAEYRIESADRIGERTLVVWGTTRGVGGGDVAGELRYQMLDGTGLFGPQHALTSTDADPHVHVQVVTLASSFLVLWMDRRIDAPGLYLQRIGLDGDLIGRAERIGGEIAPHQIFGRSTIVAGTPGDGRMLLWHESVEGRTRLNGLRVEPDGSIELPVREVGHILQQPLRFSSLPGVTILRTDSSTVMIDGSGRIDERRINDTLLIRPYHLDPDTSLLAVRGKVLEKYASIFAETPEWSVPVPALDSAAENTVMIGRDSAGSPFILFTTILITGHEFTAGVFTISTWKIPITMAAQPPFAYPELVYSLRTLNGPYDFPSGDLYEIHHINFRSGCDNSVSVVIKGICRIIYHGQAGQWRDVSWEFSLDGTGIFRDDNTGYDFLCPSATVPVYRDTNGDSLAAVQSAGKSVTWSTPIALHQDTVSQTTPCMTNRNGRLLCAWFDRSDGAVLSIVPSFLQGPVTALDTLRHTFPGVNLGGQPGFDLVGQGTIQQKEEFQVYGTMVVDMSNYSRYFDTRIAHPSEVSSYRTTANAFRLYGSGLDKWDSVFVRNQTAQPGSEGDRHDGSILGFNPDTEWFLIGLYQVYYTQTIKPYPNTIYLISSDGKILRQQPNIAVREAACWMPVDTSNWLVIGNARGTMLRNKDTLYSFPLSPVAGRAYVAPLNGSSFLRTYRLDAGSNILVLETYDIEGGLIDQGSLLTTSDNIFSTKTICLQRPTDSAIAILWGTEDDGVHAALLDKHLRVITDDVAVSHTRGRALNPSGIFSGDTLYVVWEDYRNGEADIYGNGLTEFADVVGGVATTGNASATLTAHILPNPTGGAFRIEFNRPVRSSTKLELFDLLGSLVWCGEITAGSTTGIVPAQGRRPGTYFLRWRSGERTGSARVMIAGSVR